MNNYILPCLLVAISLNHLDGLIIPNELPTILSLVYSNIPPLKIGQDTRFGIGFRLGPHADFQTLIELGPQTNTRPIGTDASSKRDATRAVPSSSFSFLPRPPGRPSKNLQQDQLPLQVAVPVEDHVEEEKKKIPPKKTSSYLMDKITFKKVPGIDT